MERLYAAAAAAAAKSLQSCPTLCDHIDGSPPGSPIPEILQARILEWVALLLQCIKVKRESEVAQSCLTLSNPMDCSLPGYPIHGFSRQEYWSGVPLPSPDGVSKTSLIYRFIVKLANELKREKIRTPLISAIKTHPWSQYSHKTRNT